MKKYLSFALSGFTAFVTATLVSCSMDEPSATSPQEHEANDPYLITLEEALKNADNEFAVAYEGQTRSGRVLKSMENFKKKTTRSDADELNGFYIVNYDEGFAILSADKRRPKVLALSDSGELHLKDTLQNEGLNWYINSALGNLGGYNPPLDSIRHKWEPPYEYTSTTVYSKPLITGFRAAFHQGDPYNRDCPIINGKRALVGCGPLAIGTVMSYYKWPESSDGFSYDWNSMLNNSYHANWPLLFSVIGKPNHTNANYEASATTKPNTYAPTFNGMGYKGAKCSQFSSVNISTELENKRPLVCYGIKKSDSINHVWVIDGGYHTLYVRESVVGGYYSETYYHCLWGLGTLGNGYFLYTTTSGSLGGAIYDDKNTYTGTQSPGTYKDLYLIHGYTPNK